MTIVSLGTLDTPTGSIITPTGTLKTDNRHSMGTSQMALKERQQLETRQRAIEISYKAHASVEMFVGN